MDASTAATPKASNANDERLALLATVKTRQQSAWSSGNYAVVGTTLQIVGESLCEALDLSSGERVLDVAAGNGNATLAAARRFCEVTSTDYVPALLARGQKRAEADGLEVTFREADAEALPFADGSFDAVMSTFGVMFTPNQEKAAAELLRVARPGGRIGLANWTPAGFIGELFKTIGRHVPPPAGISSPALWGTRERLEEFFGASGTLTVTPKHFSFRYRSPEHFLDVFRTWYGPVLKAFAALPDENGRAALAGDILALATRFNRAKDGTLVAPGEYLEVVFVKD